MDCHFLLQEIFPSQESNPSLLHCRHTLPSEPPGKPREIYIYDSLPIEVPTEHCIEFPLLFSGYLFYTQQCIYVTPNSSRSPFPPWYPYFCSPHLCLFLLGKCVPLYNIPRFHICALISSICFSLSDLVQCVWQSVGPSMSLQVTQFCSFAMAE